MKPADEVKRDLVRQWLAKAEEDLAVANHLLSESAPYPGAIGFHAQQAAEKFLKAFLVHHQVEFPKTHALNRLLDLISSVDAPLADSLQDAIILTPYGVNTRYPSEFPEMSPERMKEAVTLARKVRDAIRLSLEGYVGESGA